MKIINIYNAKTQFSSLIEQVVTKGTVVIIGKAGKAVAKIVPYEPAKSKRKLGYLKGKVKIAADFDQWPDDLAASFWNQIVKYLLDTHVLLWSVAGAGQLGLPVKQIIESADNIIFVSLVSLWELRIKESIGKVGLPKNFYRGLQGAGFELLAISLEHIQALGDLPSHHRDPFDRMLIVQAQCEQMTLITKDDEIQKYDLSLLKV